MVVCVVKAQEDVTEGQKRDGEVEEEEDPYNEENLEQVRNQEFPFELPLVWLIQDRVHILHIFSPHSPSTWVFFSHLSFF